MVQNIRKFVLSLRQLPPIVRFLSVVLSFISIESLIVLSANRGISSLLLIPGVLACWLFMWRLAFAHCWGLLWVHMIVLVLWTGWSGQLIQTFVAGTITDIVLVGSFGSLHYGMNRAKELANLREDFIRNVNHELRSPLTAVSSSIDILRRNDLDHEGRQTFLDYAEYGCCELE